jgi:hypothetical protein
MNKKDVLGASAAAWNVQKMKSMPPRLECWKCSKYSTQQGGNGGKFWRYLVSDTMPKLNHFSRELNLQISCVFVMFDIKMISNVAQAT